MNGQNPKVDFYFDKEEKWRDELDQLRTIVLDCGLDEELKWGCPCYTFRKSNILLLHTFKEYCAVLFFKGALLKDSDGILVQQTKNVQAARQMRFANIHELVALKGTLKSYILEAIEIEAAGLKVDLKKTAEFTVADEFKKKLDKNPALRTAFDALTPGRQRPISFTFLRPNNQRLANRGLKNGRSKFLTGRD